jgi:hypothetical protein
MVERRLLDNIPWMAMMRKHIRRMNSMVVSGTVSFFRGSVFLHRYSTLTKYFFTGCLKCYARDTVNKVSEKTMHDLHQATMEKTQYLKDRGLHVVEMWECDMNKELEHDEDMKQYFEDYDVVDPLEPRHAFYGGQTNATKLFHECKEDEKIRYVVSAPQ